MQKPGRTPKNLSRMCIQYDESLEAIKPASTPGPSFFSSSTFGMAPNPASAAQHLGH